jgi:hypothetical protein
LKTNRQLIVKWKNFFFLATIIQEKLLRISEPIKNSGTKVFPSDGITNEPHLIYSAEISATGTIPSLAVLL